MRKRLFVWLLPVLFGWQLVDSTEIPFELSAQEEYDLTQTAYANYFKGIPQNPNVYDTTPVYSDAELTTVSGNLRPNQIFSITGVSVNSKKELVFQIDKRNYLVADTSVIFSDTISQEVGATQTYWLNNQFTILSSPISNQSTVQKSKLQPYQPVTVSKTVTTPKGTFANLADGNWVSFDDLSPVDNRIDAVQTLLTSKYGSKKNIGVYVKQLSTGLVAGIHQDQVFYSASISKLPILYVVQEQINSGAFSLDKKVKYTAETMKFKGAYKSAGSGSLSKTPDNKEYSIEELINKTAKESDNVASNLLAYYVTNQFDKDFTRQINEAIGDQWNMVTRETSVTMAGLMMEALYKQNGFVLNSLKSTNFDDQRIPKDIDVPVAHKIGDADDVKHDVAIVYTEEPFVLAIFTDKSSYEEISQIANDVYGILK